MVTRWRPIKVGRGRRMEYEEEKWMDMQGRGRNGNDIPDT